LRRTISLVSVPLLVGFGLSCAAISANAAPESNAPSPFVSDQNPPPPEWVKTDGSVDASKVPEELPVLGGDGAPAKDSGGRALCASLNIAESGGAREVSREVKEDVETVVVQPQSPKTHICKG
jgi:hypothetical protein